MASVTICREVSFFASVLSPFITAGFFLPIAIEFFLSLDSAFLGVLDLASVFLGVFSSVFFGALDSIFLGVLDSVFFTVAVVPTFSFAVFASDMLRICYRLIRYNDRITQVANNNCFVVKANRNIETLL